MSIETLEIRDAGLLTTVQDTGRYGYQRFGVPVSGAMDVFALQAANILVGNDEGAAGLEMTVLGPRIRFLADTWIALTGGDLSPTLDGEPLPLWRSAQVTKESVLSFQGARDGVRSYLTIAGGIDVPVVMGSRSTYIQGAIGGFEGRALKAGDRLHTLDQDPGAEFVERRLPEHLAVPSYGNIHQIRVVLGPQDQAFTSDGIATFLASKYTISIHSDRIGYRLEGPSIEHVSGPDIVSDGTPLGAVQIPGDGHPLILLADRGTTGGYSKIATVISSDIGKLAQAMPCNILTFNAVSVEEAHAILREQEEVLAAIRRDSARASIAPNLSIAVDGQTFEVLDEAEEPVTIPENDDGTLSGQSRRVRATVDGRTYEFEVELQQVD